MSESRGTGRGRREPKSRRARIQVVVLHSDPGTSDRDGDGDEELSVRFPSHYYVDAAGRVAGLRPETTVPQHIGNAQWQGRNRNIDRISIGITVAQTPGAP